MTVYADSSKGEDTTLYLECKGPLDWISTWYENDNTKLKCCYQRSDTGLVDIVTEEEHESEGDAVRFAFTIPNVACNVKFALFDVPVHTDDVPVLKAGEWCDWIYVEPPKA